MKRLRRVEPVDRLRVFDGECEPSRWGVAYEIVPDDLPVRSFSATPMALGLSRWVERRYLETVVLVLDTDRDEFVRLPLDPLSHGEVLALAHNGQHLLLRGPHDDIDLRFRVGIHTMRTGELRFFDEGPDGSDLVAGLSPDGRQIAALVVAANPAASSRDGPDSTLAAVSLIDVPTGRRQRIWTGPVGGCVLRARSGGHQTARTSR